MHGFRIKRGIVAHGVPATARFGVFDIVAGMVVAKLEDGFCREQALMSHCCQFRARFPLPMVLLAHAEHALMLSAVLGDWQHQDAP